MTEPFIYSGWKTRNTLDIDDYRLLQMEFIGKIYDLFGNLASPLMTGIITTNYDMLFEYTLGSGGFHYGREYEKLLGTVKGPYPYVKNKSTFLSGSIPLAKLHGSISWDDKGYYTDARRALTGKALIVAPTREKWPHPLLERTWNFAAQILKRTSRLIVFGFAFNEYDQAVLQLLRKNGRELKHVLIVDVNPNKKAALDLWPKTTITTSQAPPAGDNDIRKWINDGFRNFWIDLSQTSNNPK